MVVVVVASAGRPEILAELLRSCAQQVGVAFRVVVSVPSQESLPTDRRLLEDAIVVIGARGAAVQRNAALDTLRGDEIVVFFDDDSVVRPDFLLNAQKFFVEHPSVVGLTGRVILDGATSGEVPSSKADLLLEESSREPLTGSWATTRELYGCNFAFRMDAAPDMRFDGRLPLYSWLEDRDFARRLAEHGQLAVVEDCVIVHRAATSGGQKAHKRLGYSQVMNPVYLARKGSFPVWLACEQIFRPVAKNLLLSVAGPARSWRRERLAGNWLAAVDASKGRITPERIVELA